MRRPLAPAGRDGPGRFASRRRLLCALLFDDTGEPILLSFAEQHGIDIRVETLETNLGLFLLSYYAPHEVHISEFLAEILLNPEVRASYRSTNRMERWWRSQMVPGSRRR